MVKLSTRKLKTTTVALSLARTIAGKTCYGWIKELGNSPVITDWRECPRYSGRKKWEACQTADRKDTQPLPHISYVMLVASSKPKQVRQHRHHCRWPFLNGMNISLTCQTLTAGSVTSY